MPDKDIIYNVAFFLGTIIAVVVAYFRKPPGSTPDKVSVTTGVGLGIVSKEAEERRDELERRKVLGIESIAKSLEVLADRERHELQETMEEGWEKIEGMLKRLERER